MKNIHNLLLLLLLSTAAACSKDQNTSEPPVWGSSFDLVFEYEERTYELGESIQATLTVTQKNAPADFFLMRGSLSGGPATLTVDGQPIQWQDKQRVDFEIVNQEFASKVLRLEITPAIDASAKQAFAFTFTISSARGPVSEKVQIYASLENNAEIQTSIQFDNEPIELEQQLGIVLAAQKEGYTGTFTVTPAFIQGEGFFVVDGVNYTAGQPFPIASGTELDIQYQPQTVGSHEFYFILTDQVCSAQETARAEVFNQGGVTKPLNGIYIYTSEGMYYTAARYLENLDDVSGTPEGVAIVAEQSSFLLAPKRSSGYWADKYGISGNYPALIPELTWAEREAALQDFNGRKNTQALLDAYNDGLISSAAGARFCYNYDTANPGLWYLPAAGQVNLIIEHIGQVQKCLKLIGGQPFEYAYMSYSHASSTGRNKNDIWSLCYMSASNCYLGLSSIGSSLKYYPIRDL